MHIRVFGGSFFLEAGFFTRSYASFCQPKQLPHICLCMLDWLGSFSWFNGHGMVDGGK